MTDGPSNIPSRREFLRNSAYAAGALALPGSLLAACGNGGGGGGSGGKSIRMSAVAEPIADHIRTEIVPAFTEQTGISVQIDTTDYASLHAKQILQLQAEEYDVFQVDQVWIQEYGRSQFLEPLDSMAEDEVFDAFYPNLVEIGRVDGSLWTLPLSAIPVNYSYREDLLTAAGASPAETWDDVLSIARNVPGDGQFGFAVRGERGNPITWTWLPMLWSFGGEAFDQSEQPVYNSEAGVRSLEFFKELYATSPPGWLSAQDVASAMQQDQAVQTTLMSVYNAAMNDPSASQVAGKIAFGQMPSQEKRASILGMWTVGIGAKSQNKDAAWEFIAHLSTPEIATEMALAGPVGATQPATYAAPDAPDYFPVLGEVLGYAQPPPLITQGEKWFEITGTELQNALSDVKTPKAALDDAVAQIGTIL